MSQHLSAVLQSDWIGRQDVLTLVGHHKERPHNPQPQCGRCHQAGTGLTTLEIIGSKQTELCTEMVQAKHDDDDDDDVFF